MPVYICMLRGVNVGGHNKIKMDALRELCTSLQLADAQTCVQSGNAIFRADETNESSLRKTIQTGIEERFGFRPEVILRTGSEMRKVVRANPFRERTEIEWAKLIVSFLPAEPAAEVKSKLSAITAPEELHLLGRELYIYFPDGAGRSKLVPVLDRILKTEATARNWNSVTRMLEIAGRLQTP
jgi:uncharacterized protein (DUF1697 family)